MTGIEIICYIKNKPIYKIELQMTRKKLLKQIENNKIMYLSSKTGGTEIINLNMFDRVVFNKNIEIED